MKKSKVLIATLALSAALMGTGYAYWTQTLTVDATVQSAKFDVHFVTDKTLTSQANKESEDATGENNYYNELKVTEKTATNAKYSWTNIYPGSSATFSFQIENKSTIPVHAKPIIKVDSLKGLDNELVYTVTVGGEQVGTKDMKQDAMTSALAELDKTIAENGGTLDVAVTVKMPTEVINLNSAEDKVTFNAKMVWGQFNDKEPTEPQTTSQTPSSDQ